MTKENVGVNLCCVFCLQSMMSASADSTTVMRTPCASTWLEATAVRVSRATLAMGQSAKVNTTFSLSDVLFIIHALIRKLT